MLIGRRWYVSDLNALNKQISHAAQKPCLSTITVPACHNKYMLHYSQLYNIRNSSYSRYLKSTSACYTSGRIIRKFSGGIMASAERKPIMRVWDRA